MQSSRGSPWNHPSLGIAGHGGEGSTRDSLQKCCPSWMRSQARNLPAAMGEKRSRSEKFCFASGAGEGFPGRLGSLGVEAGLGRSCSEHREVLKGWQEAGAQWECLPKAAQD